MTIEPWSSNKPNLPREQPREEIPEQITSDIVGKRRTMNGPLQDLSGVLVTELAAVNELWPSHFKRLHNSPLPDEPSDINATLFFSLNISVESPSAVEIQAAANWLQNSKSPGEDCISVEMIKASAAALITFWTAFFATIWEKGASWLEAQHTNTPIQKEWCHCPWEMARNKLAFGPQ